MGTYFSLIKYIGRDIREIGDNLTEDTVKKILLRSDDESLFQVSEFDQDGHNGDGIPLLIEHVNGEEWLNNHL